MIRSRAKAEGASDQARVTLPEAAGLSDQIAQAMRPTAPLGRAVHDFAEQVAQRHLSLGRRGLSLCGASAGTGVSLTATCLAISLANRGTSTLLLEADLHRPFLDRFIRPTAPALGLLQYLQQEAKRDDAIQREVLPNLSVLFAGGSAGAPDELFASARFRQLIDDCVRDFECVIVDTAPANRYADARTVAVAVGYAAIVGRRQYSFVNDTALLSRQLSDAGVKVVGTIFNGA